MRITQMVSQTLSLYAKGMSKRKIGSTFKEIYDSDVSTTLTPKVTDVVKVCENGSVINRAVLLALLISIEGEKELGKSYTKLLARSLFTIFLNCMCCKDCYLNGTKLVDYVKINVYSTF